MLVSRHVDALLVASCLPRRIPSTWSSSPGACRSSPSTVPWPPSTSSPWRVKPEGEPGPHRLPAHPGHRSYRLDHCTAGTDDQSEEKRASNRPLPVTVRPATLCEGAHSRAPKGIA